MKFIKIISLLFVLFGLTGCAWFHKTQEPIAPLVSFQPTLPVKEAWSTSAGGTYGHYLKLTPAVDGNRIYAASYRGNITAVDTQTGKHIWVKKTRTHLTSGIGLGNGYLFVGSSEGEVLAFCQADGARVWRGMVSNEVLAEPYAYGDIVLVKSADDHLYALDLHSGRMLWDYVEELPELILRGASSPRAANNLAVAGFADGQIGVFVSCDGGILWKRPIAEPKGSSVVERMIDVADNVQVVGGVIYAATYQGSIAALELQSGRILWQHDLSSYAGLTVCGNRVFVTDSESHVWAFDRQTGALVWRQDKLFGRHLTGPAVIGDVVVVADGKGYVHWLSAQDGCFLARTMADNAGIVATPIVYCGAVYIYGNSGRLIKYIL